MENPSSPTVEMLSGGMITIEVGTPPTTFMIHENLAVARSGFFKGALHGHFKESETRKIPIPEDECDLVACLVHWLYTGTLDLALSMAADSEPEQSEEEETLPSEEKDGNTYEDTVGSHEHAWSGLLFELWILGDKLQIPDFQNDITAKIVELSYQVTEHDDGFSSTPSQETLEFVYENTVTNSPLRRLVIDLFILKQPDIPLIRSMGSLSEEIVRDIGRTLIMIWRTESFIHPSQMKDHVTRTYMTGGYTRARES
ncbi:hypothetical protein GTA08_BOTSDO05386 [Neofusicoccum parvum]|uniref:Putative btb poz domain containing protein n=1 Tax=Botryosphaeria parva (strain UCR-NP2) TaxID=1287680 RepID=R1GVC6_BOTPV|nr:putative btb poz domain containing protein [Neofusicoccum parvum UCRNP2]GME33747.1 hypothetical protein GTA08_BOTSDO05386 [Neofusicoccum parvum]